MSARSHTKNAPAKQKAGSRTAKKDAATPPKRSCNAFCFFLKDQKSVMSSTGPQLMKDAREQWNQMSAEQKVKFERKAQADKERYTRQKEEMKKKQVKRPCNAYMQFMSDFMKKNSKNYSNVTEAVSAGAAQWRAMSDREKTPWRNMAQKECDEYNKKKNKLTKSAPVKVAAAKRSTPKVALKAKASTKAKSSKTKKAAGRTKKTAAKGKARGRR